MSARQEDLNGYIEVKGNPLSKVGVFPYLGSQISDSLMSDKIYYVYRPEKELSDPACLDSFRLIPFTNDHAMLGSSDEGLMPAERKGVHGTTGENIYFESPYLKGNLKVFSESLAAEIEDGKQEISIGYRCKYRPESGVYDGMPYDFVQCEMRGNHVALVDEGRSGPDVKVLDHFKITLDSGALRMEENTSSMPDVIQDDDQEKPKMSLEDAHAKIKDLDASLEALKSLLPKDAKKSADQEVPNLGMADKAKDEDLDDDEDDDEDDYADDKKSADKKSGMDMNDIKNEIKKSLFAEIEKRDRLYKKVKSVIGTFAHDGMTLRQVAEYGAKKIGINCKKGHEQAAIDGYLLAKSQVSHIQASTMDSSHIKSLKSSSLQEYINKGAQ